MSQQLHRLPLRQEPSWFSDARSGRVKIGKWFLQSNQVSTWRMAVIVSKKSVRKATDRNRVKRRLRAALTTVLTQHPLPIDVILVGSPAVLTVSYSELVAAVKQLLTQAKT